MVSTTRRLPRRPATGDSAPRATRTRGTPLGRLAAIVLGLAALAAQATPFPRPAELEPDIRFWTRVFTEVDTGGGFVHDNRRLDVVYDTLRFTPGAGPDQERTEASEAVERYAGALRALADGKRTDLTDVEAQALRAWGTGASEATLREAAERVRFQRGQADKFREGYVRSGRWRGYIDNAFRSRGLPAELAALPHVESSYNPAARSHAGAAGLWQFTVPTGKRYLQIDRWTDERMDPYKATDAAAQLLQRNHEITGSWPLALTAYNHGAGGVMRAVRAMGTDDIVTIVRGYDGPSFGFASRNFYVSFLAALDVERNAEAHFGPLARTEAEPAGADRELRVASPAQVARTEPRAPAKKKVRYQRHRVRPGETLSGIAARYGVSHREIMELNGLRSAKRLRAGETLRVPAGTG